ncbi:hypothetical protein Scep_026359 [Stephania cephalantha]|uniref:DUF4216 domain-containing protein n=1 Tax=Stephania cephalantha TaxID=152367 RepID=A0AAP0HT90_9MAGN
MPNITNKAVNNEIDRDFPDWFKSYAKNNIQDETLLYMSYGPLRQCLVYPAYFVNGYKFHTVTYDASMSTQNSSVCVKGSNYTESECDYYGKLQEVIQIEYHGQKRAMLFKCDWFDTTPEVGTRAHRKLHLIEVHRNRRLNKYEPFILAMQACQVYYLPYPSLRRDRYEWLAVCNLHPRLAVEQTIVGNVEERVPRDTAFQEDQIADGVVEVDNELTITSLRDSSGSQMSDDEEGDESEDENLHLSSDNENEDEADFNE